jgi:hypothetical protein
MPKETIADSSEGNLVRLKYTFRFGDKFDEPDDDWLKCIEATSDELLGAYSKAEDNALSAAFRGRNKKRLNKVFDAIGFVYPDYCYLLRGQGVKRKISASGKVAASAIIAKPKGKKMKVLTHWPHYIEPVVIPEFGKGTCLAAEAKEIVPTVQSTKEPVERKIEEPKIEELMKMPEILNPSIEIKLPKVQKASAATPKRRRMANVLDVVLETMKALSPALANKVVPTETKSQARTETRQAEAAQVQAEAKAGPSVPIETEPATLEEKATEQIASEKIETSAPEASNKSIEYIIRHASGKELSQGEMLEAQHYAQKIEISEGGISV